MKYIIIILFITSVIANLEYEEYIQDAEYYGAFNVTIKNGITLTRIQNMVFCKIDGIEKILTLNLPQIISPQYLYLKEIPIRYSPIKNIQYTIFITYICYSSIYGNITSYPYSFLNIFINGSIIFVSNPSQPYWYYSSSCDIYNSLHISNIEIAWHIEPIIITTSNIATTDIYSITSNGLTTGIGTSNIITTGLDTTSNTTIIDIIINNTIIINITIIGTICCVLGLVIILLIFRKCRNKKEIINYYPIPQQI